MTLNLGITKWIHNGLKENVNLSNYSWFNLGGKADYFFKAEDKIQLINFLKEAKK